MHCRTCGKEVHPEAVVCLSCGAAPRLGKNYCHGCGGETNPEAAVCMKCGVSLAPPPAQTNQSGRQMIHPPQTPYSPLVMFLASFCCIAGLGQIILGQTIKGVVILLISIVMAVITMGFSAIILWPLGGIDAYCIAKKLQSGKSVGEWEFF